MTKVKRPHLARDFLPIGNFYTEPRRYRMSHGERHTYKERAKLAFVRDLFSFFREPQSLGI
jgi:hypothetical protein